MPRVDFRLCVITDRRAAEAAGRSLPALLRTALRPAARRGARVAVQLREKDLDGGPLLALARELRAVTRDHGARLFVNDRLDVALAAEADGVHLPSDGLPPEAARRLLAVVGLVGLSAHSANEVGAGHLRGADFALLGPIFDTPSKRAYGPPLGVAALASAAATAGMPVLAVGGLDPARVREVRAAGAHGIAAIGAFMAARDPAGVMEAFLDALEAAEGTDTVRGNGGSGGRDGGGLR